MTGGGGDFGVAPSARAKLAALFERTPGLERVWVFGSRAKGTQRPESDIDLAFDAPAIDAKARADLADEVQRLGLLYRVDAVFLQDRLDEPFRRQIERDQVLLWEPRPRVVVASDVGGVSLKDFQRSVLDALSLWIGELKKHKAQAETAQAALRAMEGMDDVMRDASDFPKKSWLALKKAGRLPQPFAEQPHSSRFDGAARAIPNACLKVPTGGGKTLLAAASVAQVFTSYLNRHTGLVLWVVPNEAIYRQTLKALSHRDHPYRQVLNVAGAGRVKILEKNSPLTRLDVESHLCVMLLMLQSAARQSKETLRFFRDRGNVLGFLPGEDDVQAHWELLEQTPNLDAYAPWGASEREARAQKGSIVKSSLGNVMRLVRPVVVIDEGHHAYTDNALATIDGFNPCFMLELSATPRVAGPKSGGSNILVNVRGSDLDEAEMIKLPIHVDVRPWNDWQSCLAASVQRLDALQAEADTLRAETARYIRPILLVQVERTGADLRDAGFIHAEDAKAYLLQLGFTERQIAIKTSERNDLEAPENIDLLSPTCEVRAIVTKQALQEGWDCPFAYVLCALAAGRNLSAMTQLVGRILRLPQTAKTGREALDACWVLCYDVRTGEVVGAIKKSLEGEGMGDLGVAVRSSGGNGDEGNQRVLQLQRRQPWRGVRLFVPTVTWVEGEGQRRPLVYESDVLNRVPWDRIDPAAFATDWAPDPRARSGGQFTLGLELLEGEHAAPTAAVSSVAQRVDRARIVRSLIDIAPNGWLVWQWVSAVMQRLLTQGWDETALAGSTASLIERLRIDLEAARDQLAEDVFLTLLSAGQIEFRLRADATDYELPEATQMQIDGAVKYVLREADLRPAQKSLLEPAVATGLNDFEVKVAGYLDERGALQWWHRNVAKSQVGLQGWKRHKVYPDFVFALTSAQGVDRMVLLETKGAYLAGEDTAYKQRLLSRLHSAYRDERLQIAGQLALDGGGRTELVCDLVFDAGWRGTLNSRYFAEPCATERQSA